MIHKRVNVFIYHCKIFVFVYWLCWNYYSRKIITYTFLINANQLSLYLYQTSQRTMLKCCNVINHHFVYSLIRNNFILFITLCIAIFTILIPYCLWHMKRNNYNVSKTVWPSGLRRVTWNHFSSGGVGSNPATVVFYKYTTREYREYIINK